jgi:transposase
MTQDLEAMRDWLKGVTHIGMESTGIYWRPVHTILEGHFELIVANAHHIKNVPGRKTDVKDAEWTADLVRHGLVKPSFMPPPPIRDLRDLVRLRRSLAEALATEQNRTLKLLEHQAGQRGEPGVWRVRPGDAEGADREHRHAAGDGGPGEAGFAPQAGALALDGRLSEHHRYLPPPAGRGDRGGSVRARRAP